MRNLASLLLLQAAFNCADIIEERKGIEKTIVNGTIGNKLAKEKNYGMSDTQDEALEDYDYSSNEDIENIDGQYNSDKKNIGNDNDYQELYDIKEELTEDVCKRCSCTSMTPYSTTFASFNISKSSNDSSAFDMISISCQGSSLLTSPNISRMDVVTLDLSNNNITELSQYQFAPLASSLVNLNLSTNWLSVEGLHNNCLHQDPIHQSESPWVLESLSMADNTLHSLPPNIFTQLGKLKHLDISMNHLGEMDTDTATAIGSVVSLQSLTLTDCQLTFLPQSLLQGMEQLAHLDLSGNPFTLVDPRVRLAPSLLTLKLDRTHLQNLDQNSFKGLETLRNLSVSSNLHLHSLEMSTMDPLTQLEEFQLSGNPLLEWIHPNAWSNIQTNSITLRVLNISGNGLKYLPRMLLPWQNIQVLDIRDNPWECDCHNDWMVTTLVPSIQNKTSHLAMGILCAGPDNTDVVKVEMLEVGGRHNSSNLLELPCDTAEFDPWRRDFHLASPSAAISVPGSALTIGVVTVCVLSILGTAALVMVLHRQKVHRGGRRLRFPRAGSAKNVPYIPAQGSVGVRTGAGVGIINTEYRDTEQEMKEIHGAPSPSPYSRPSVSTLDWSHGPK